MKKEIKLENVLFIGVIVVIIYVLTICMFMNRINGYEEKLERSSNDYEKVLFTITRDGVVKAKRIN